MTRRRRSMAVAIGAAALGMLAAARVGSGPDEARLGGPATVEAEGRHAFGMASPGLTVEERRAFAVGNSFFRDNWIVAPASAEGRDGLGPLFNANSCSACHPDDGRGVPPLDLEHRGRGAVLLLATGDAGEGHPIYGRQLQDQGVPGVPREADLRVEPVSVAGAYPDGTPYQLVRWDLVIGEPAYGSLAGARTSLRVGQQLIGLGLLEAIEDRAILDREDPEDRDGDGVSGRARRIVAADGGVRVGRFGWKAAQPTLELQVMAALHEDMGLTSPAHPKEPVTAAQPAALAAPSGGSPEVDAGKVDRIAHYVRTLAVPAARRAEDPEVLLGRRLFAQAGCASCHLPEWRTGEGTPIAAFRGATIRPYTDLLLHDMGEALADDRPEPGADPREWRTPPLWGIGLVQVVTPEARFLHDGRAATIEEAVLWHDGEAEGSRRRFMELDRRERAALLAFVESL